MNAKLLALLCAVSLALAGASQNALAQSDEKVRFDFSVQYWAANWDPAGADDASGAGLWGPSLAWVVPGNWKFDVTALFGDYELEFEEGRREDEDVDRVDVTLAVDKLFLDHFSFRFGWKYMQFAGVEWQKKAEGWRSEPEDDANAYGPLAGLSAFTMLGDLPLSVFVHGEYQYLILSNLDTKDDPDSGEGLMFQGGVSWFTRSEKGLVPDAITVGYRFQSLKAHENPDYFDLDEEFSGPIVSVRWSF